MNLKSIIDLLEQELKLYPQESWDNTGLQVGNLNQDIKNVMLTLDIDLEGLEYAIENNVDLIIAHHPFLYSPIKSVDLSTYEGKIIEKLIKNNISLYSIHTSLDMADYGINTKIAEKLNIDNFELLHEVHSEKIGYGGVANIEPQNIVEFAERVKSSLNADHVKLYCDNKDKIVSRVAFCGGGASGFIEDAIKKNAEVYITGDVKYHQAQVALQNNLCIIDAGHFNTECHALEYIKDVLSSVKELKVLHFEKNTAKEQII